MLSLREQIVIELREIDSQSLHLHQTKIVILSVLFRAHLQREIPIHSRPREVKIPQLLLEAQLHNLFIGANEPILRVLMIEDLLDVVGYIDDSERVSWLYHDIGATLARQHKANYALGQEVDGVNDVPILVNVRPRLVNPLAHRCRDPLVQAGWVVMIVENADLLEDFPMHAQ